MVIDCMSGFVVFRGAKILLGVQCLPLYAIKQCQPSIFVVGDGFAGRLYILQSLAMVDLTRMCFLEAVNAQKRLPILPASPPLA